MHPQQSSSSSMAETGGILPDLSLFGNDGLLNELEKSSTCSDSDFVLPASPFLENGWQDQEVGDACSIYHVVLLCLQRGTAKFRYGVLNFVLRGWALSRERIHKVTHNYPHNGIQFLPGMLGHLIWAVSMHAKLAYT